MFLEIYTKQKSQHKTINRKKKKKIGLLSILNNFQPGKQTCFLLQIFFSFFFCQSTAISKLADYIMTNKQYLRKQRTGSDGIDVNKRHLPRVLLMFLQHSTMTCCIVSRNCLCEFVVRL